VRKSPKNIVPGDQVREAARKRFTALYQELAAANGLATTESAAQKQAANEEQEAFKASPWMDVYDGAINTRATKLKAKIDAARAARGVAPPPPPPAPIPATPAATPTPTPIPASARRADQLERRARPPKQADAGRAAAIIKTLVVDPRTPPEAATMSFELGWRVKYENKNRDPTIYRSAIAEAVLNRIRGNDRRYRVDWCKPDGLGEVDPDALFGNTAAKAFPFAVRDRAGNLLTITKAGKAQYTVFSAYGGGTIRVAFPPSQLHRLAELQEIHRRLLHGPRETDDDAEAARIAEEIKARAARTEPSTAEALARLGIMENDFDPYVEGELELALNLPSSSSSSAAYAVHSPPALPPPSPAPAPPPPPSPGPLFSAPAGGDDDEELWGGDLFADDAPVLDEAGEGAGAADAAPAAAAVELSPEDIAEGEAWLREMHA
jgi:hypothetical protein